MYIISYWKLVWRIMGHLSFHLWLLGGVPFVFQSKSDSLTLCDPVDCSTPGFPVLLLSSPGVCSNSCSLSWWWHPTISSSVIPFFSCSQSFPASGVPTGGLYLFIFGTLMQDFHPFSHRAFKIICWSVTALWSITVVSCFLTFHWWDFTGSSFVSGVLCIANVSPTSLSWTSEILLSFAKTSNFHIRIDSHHFELYCDISNKHQQSEVNTGKYIDWMGSKVVFLLVQNESLWNCKFICEYFYVRTTFASLNS